MSGVKGLPAFVDRWPDRWRERFVEIHAEMVAKKWSEQKAATEAERRVRGEYFTHELRTGVKNRMGSVPERSRPNTDPNQMTFADRTAPND